MRSRRERVPRLLGDDAAIVLGGRILDSGHDKAGRGVGLDANPGRRRRRRRRANRRR
jgi:hypothetical protein